MTRKRSFVPVLLPLLAAVVVALGFTLWLREGGNDLQRRLPGADEAGPPAPRGEDTAFVEGGKRTSFEVAVPDIPGRWPRFRGATSDAVCTTPGGAIDTDWRTAPPREVWALEVGEGYAGAAVLDGRVFLLDYDAEKQRDVVRCLSLQTGEDIWRYSYPVQIKRNHGMSRTVPAVTDQYVLTVGPKGHVHCLATDTGERLWAIDLVGRYGTRIPPWYAAQCPLIDGEHAILAPAGTSLLVAIALSTGEVVWETPNPNNWTMTHTSVMPVQLGVRRTYVYTASGGVVGVSADDGSVLWEYADWQVSTANVPSPVFLAPGTLLLTGGYDAGSLILRLTEGEAGIEPVAVRRLATRRFGAHQHTPVAYQGHLYGIGDDGQLTCLDRNGAIVWKSGRRHTFGKAAYIVVDGNVLAFDDDGMLHAVRATPERFEMLGKTRVLDGPDAWGPMACAAGRLIVRDLTELKCLQLEGG